MTVPTGDISQTAPDWFSAAVSDSVHTAAGSGADTWWPIERGCVSRLLSGSTSRSSIPSTSASGLPRTGNGSLKRAASAAGVAGVDTRPSPVAVSAEVPCDQRGKRRGRLFRRIALEILEHALNVTVHAIDE